MNVQQAFKVKNTTCYNLLYLDDIQTHINDMLSTGAVVSCSGVTLEGITEVTTVQVMVPQVIMASPGRHRVTRRFVCIKGQSVQFKTRLSADVFDIIPDALFNGVSFVVFEISVQFL